MNKQSIDRSKVTIKPHKYVKVGKDIFKITQTIDFNTVVGINVKTGKAQSILVSEIKGTINKEDLSNHEQDNASYSDEQWIEIEKRFNIIKPLIEKSNTKEDVEQVANDNGIHYVTLYRWLRNYRNSGSITSLLPQKRGSTPGSGRISIIAEAIIEKNINEHYLTKQKPCVQRIIELVHVECHNKNISPPSKNTIRSRIARISHEDKLKKQGNRDKARNLYNPAQETSLMQHIHYQLYK